MIVRLKRVGDVSTELIYEAADAIASEYGLKVIVDPFKVEPPMETFNWERLQYLASALTMKLAQEKARGEFLVFLVDADAYESGLNFVFGIALPRIGAASVFLKRLRPSFYGEPEDWNLFVSRVRKEVNHELGHLIGLDHCPNPRCVMSFSNSILDVDRKSENLCEDCKLKARELLATWEGS
ncbi:peptidase M54 [Ignicoccus pacificus DSM 13166]|uniref:Archaemetzincin n=1 Tax=Ignicoccus pacificus DSM 13166 TaxID=940294 RepID=A0A977K9A3_9CREN|nr:peptidase M54 [Ignicoccus pacificus DSM 13166]